MSELRKAGVALEVQGKASYIASMKEVQQSVKNASQEMKRNIEALGNNAKATEKHAAKMKGLATQIQLTERQLKTYNDRQEYLKKSLSEYGDKVKTVNDKLKTQKSTYESVGRTLDQQKQKFDKLKTTYNESNVAIQNAKRDLENYKQSTNSTKEGITQLTNKLKSLKNEHTANGAELNLAKSKLQATKSEYKNLASELSQTQQQFKNLNSSEREQSRELEQLNSKVLQAETSYHKLNNQMQKAQTEFRNNGGRFADTAQKWQNAGTKLQTVGSTLNSVGNGVTAATSGIALGVGYVAREAINFESAFAGVRKTVDGSTQDLDNIKQSYIDLSTTIPISANELANIGEIAGQLGIKKENLVQFTRTIADLSNTTNLSSEEAATSLAQFMNVMNMSKADVDRLGSSVVSLGNNFATNERDLVNMAQRLSGMGNQTHMTEADVLGLAAAMSSVGIEAEAGGSAMTQVMNKMQNAVMNGGEGLEDFAAAARMSTTEFADAFNKRPVDALNAVLKGLKETDKAGGNVNKVLGDLGIKGLREADAVKRLAGALDGDSGLAKALEVANKGWAENTALTKEAEVRYGTTESKLKLARNEITKTAIEIGEQFLPKLVQMVHNAKPVIKMIGDLLLAFTKLPAGMQVAILGAGPFLKMLGSITSALGTGAQGIGALIKAFGKVTTAKAVGELGKLEGAAMQAGSAAPLLSNPYVLAGLAITAAVAGLGYYIYSEMTKDSRNHDLAIERTQGKYEKWFKEVTDGVRRTESELPGIKKSVSQIGDTYEKEAERIKRANTQIQESFDKLFENGGWFGRTGRGVQILKDLGLSDEEIEEVKGKLADVATMLENSMSNLIDTFGKQKVVSSDLANATINSVRAVSDSIISGLNEQKQAELDRLDSQLNNHVISKQDYEQQKSEIESTFNKTVHTITDSQNKITSIMREASQEQRSISTKEMKTIFESYDNMAKQSGQSISELATKHGELGDVLRRLTDETAVNSLKQSGVISDHAARTINSLTRTEDKYNAIKQVMEQYDGYTLHDKKLEVKDGATKILFEATKSAQNYNSINPHRLNLDATDHATPKLKDIIKHHEEVANKPLVLIPLDATDGVSPKVQSAKSNLDALPLDKTVSLFGNNDDAVIKINQVNSTDIPEKTSVVLGDNKAGMSSLQEILGTNLPNKTITSLGNNTAGMSSLHEINNTQLPNKTVNVTAETGGFWGAVNGIIGSTLGSAFISVKKMFENAEGGNITPFAEGGNVIPFANGASRVQSLTAGNVGLVGEAGPELFTVHNKGVHIQPLSTREKFKGIGGVLKEKGLGGGNEIVINIQNTINNDMDIDYVTKKTVTLLKREFREDEMFGG